MIKSKLLISLLFISIIGGCGFHTPYKNESINAKLITAKENEFTSSLMSLINVQERPKYIISVGNEKITKTLSGYSSNGISSNYNISLSIPIKVQNLSKKVLLDENFTGSSFVKKPQSRQAESLLIKDKLSQMRRMILKRVMRKINTLNET